MTSKEGYLTMNVSHSIMNNSYQLMHKPGHLDYQNLILRFQRVVQRAVPSDATVIVVSKGDVELLKLDGRQAWHFPQREDGVYAGYYPPNSAAAIAHLEALRAKGGEFLVFPQTSFWWLEHYGEFKQHLESQYRVLVREKNTCLIFALFEPGARKQQSIVQSKAIAYQQFTQQIEESGKSLQHYVGEGLVDNLRMLFDFEYYSEQASTDFPSFDSALVDYIENGFTEGYNPHVLFDTNYYLSHYLKVKRSGVNPLVHFLTHSVSEGQNPNPYFDTEYYYSQGADLRKYRVNALIHYLNYAADGKSYHPNPLFYNGYYLSVNPDVKNAKWNPLVHYIKLGRQEGRFVSHIHKNIVDELLRSSKNSLLRGNWKNGTALLFPSSESRAGAQMILQIAEVLARDYHLDCQVILFKRQEFFTEFRNYAKVLVLEDFQIACDIFRPSALWLLIETLCSMKPLFAVCEMPEMLEILKVNRVPSYYLYSGSADLYPKKVLENIFHEADRVIFTSSTDFHTTAKKVGFYPTNVSLQPYGPLSSALSDTGRGRSREELIRNLGLNKEPFIVLGGDTIAPRDGFDLFLAVAKMLRKRRPDMDIAFVWAAKKQTKSLSLPHELPYLEEIGKSGLEEVVFHIDGQQSLEEYFSAVDTFFLSSRESTSSSLISEAISAGLPVISFEDSMNGSYTNCNGNFTVPYLDVDAVCERICALYDTYKENRIVIDKVNEEIPIESYVNSLMKLAKRNFHLSADIFSLSENRAPKITRKIVIPCCDWGVSGVNSSLEALGKELIHLGWDVQIVFTRDHSVVIETAGDEAYLPQIPYRYLEPVRSGIEGMWEGLISYLENNAPCIMFMSYDFVANSIAPALTNKVGVVAWVQADDGDYYEQAYRLGRYCNAVVCVSEWLKIKVAELNPLIGDKAQVIYNTSVREEEIVGKKPVTSEKMRLIYTGRLVQYQKRILDFIELAHSLDNLGISYQLTLIGEFSPRENIRELFEIKAKDHLEDGRISLSGRMTREQILEALSDHNIFVLLSDFEGLPLALVEAMARGCIPVVAEVESGISEVIKNGENGLIVSGRDYDKWAELLANLWRNRKKLLQMSQKARRTVREQFTVEQAAKQFAELFRRIAEEISSEEYKRPPCLNWGEKRSLTGDVLPPPSMYRPSFKLPGIR